jgi:hypothetical protein
MLLGVVSAELQNFTQVKAGKKMHDVQNQNRSYCCQHRNVPFRYWVDGFADECIRSSESTSVSRRYDLMAASRDAIFAVPVSSCMLSDSLGAITGGSIGAYNASA